MANQKAAAAQDNMELEGFEEQELTIQSLPVLALAQSQTPEVAEGEIEGLKAGVLMNNVTKQPLGDSLELIVFKMWTGRTKFPPRGDNGPIECWSPDNTTGITYGDCKTCAFASFDIKDRCLEQNFFVVGLANNPRELYRLIFAKSNKRTGETLGKTLRIECSKTQSPIYGVKILLTTKRVKNEKANAYYYVYEVKPNGMVEDDKLAELRPIFLELTELRKKSLEDFKAACEAAKDMSIGGETEDESVQDTGEFKTDFGSEGDALL